jgi:4-amino-4-deoxy-L-arabinose transferase-like glycosyltransferase
MFERLSDALVASPRRFALLAAAWLVALAWFRPLTVPDEGRYTDIARWIVLTGDWLIPRLNGLPFIQKPPLYFWLEAIGIEVAGTNLLVARWVSIAGALVTLYVVHRFVRARFDANAARWSAIVLLTSPYFFSAAQFASLDMLVSACVTCTIVFAVEAAETTPEKARRLWLAAYAAAGLGVLAKGLIGIVIPALVYIVWALVTRRPRFLLVAIQWRGIVLLAAIVVPWFALVEQRIPGFLRYFFIHNHFERYAEGGFNNPRSVWYFFVLVLAGMLPWTVALVPAVRSAFAKDSGTRNVALLALVWSLGVILFFTIPRSKLAGYALPATAALAIVLGPWCASWKYRRIGVVIGVALCLVVLPLVLRARGLDPGRMASALRSEIAIGDRVVFWTRYFYSVPVILDWPRAVEVVDAWDKPSAELPDSWRRELAAGREFEPARAPGVLITPSEFRSSLGTNPARVWVWVHKEDTDAPELAGFELALQRGDYVVLRRSMK